MKLIPKNESANHSSTQLFWQGKNQPSFFSPSTIQPKLAIGAPNDKYEKEADAMADKIVGMRESSSHSALSDASPNVQTKCADCEQEGIQRMSEEEENPIQRMGQEEEQMLQTKPLMMKSDSGGGVGTSALSSKLSGTKGSGAALSKNVNQQMSSALGTDFSGVKIHTGGDAVQMNQGLSARAFTHGSDVYFNKGEYNPSSTEGKRLLGHELTHVVQQGNTNSQLNLQRVSNSSPPNAVSIPSHNEPRCTSGGTNLGLRTPTPSCIKTEEEIEGDLNLFQFCVDSDIFRHSSSIDQIKEFAQKQPSLSTFKVHAFSSIEGPGASDASRIYNENLSCFRAKRVGRELINAGVRENRIELVSKGPTERFGTGNRNRPLNRVVVLAADAQPFSPANLPHRASNEQVVNAAIAKITSGNYNLGADAYIYRWTCGRFNSLAEAVKRVTVQVTGIGRNVSEMGTISKFGLNTILLPDTLFLAQNPLESIANRITDLTFHHFARPQIPNFKQQHAGGLHLLHLGGFSACRVPVDPLNYKNISIPTSTDPFANLQPPCADLPLQRPLSNTPINGSSSPTFTLGGSGISLSGGSGPLSLTNPPRSPFMDANSNGFQLNANFTVSGNPSEITNYQVGFVQTILDENFVSEYVGGQRLLWNLPWPLRDGPSSGAPQHDPPWFDNRHRITPSLGNNRIHFEDFPAMILFRAFLNTNRTSFFDINQLQDPANPNNPVREDEPSLGLNSQNFRLNNVLNKATKNITFTTWLVARRNDAPLTLSSSNFISGVRTNFSMNADFVGGPINYNFSGNYNTNSSTAPNSDKRSMKLRGATPADFRSPSNPRMILFNEFLKQEDPTPRSQAGLNESQYEQEVNRIGRSFRNSPNLRELLILRLKIDPLSGRLLLPTRSNNRNSIVRITHQDNTTPELEQLARDMFPELRKLTANNNFNHQSGDTLILPLSRIRNP